MRWRHRLVRLHLLNDQPTVEGVLTGKTGGHYVVQAPKVLVSEDQSQSFDGHLLVPAERVLFVQVLGR